MRTVERATMSLQELADECQYRLRSTFQSKFNRDEVASILKSRGLAVRKGSMRNQQLHPEYVNDFVGTYETGFGNTDYQRGWKALYTISVER